jgi:uncharacterized Tic20 family protein
VSHPQPPDDDATGRVRRADVPPQYPYGQLPSGPYETYGQGAQYPPEQGGQYPHGQSGHYLYGQGGQYPYGQGAYPPAYGPPPGHPMPYHDGPRPGSDDTTFATLAHVLGLVTSWIGPLVIYLAKKDQSPYVRRQAAEALNFQLTMFIAYLVAVLLSIVLIGLLLMPVIWVVTLVFHIQAAVATNRGAAYRYPVSIRMIT